MAAASAAIGASNEHADMQEAAQKRLRTCVGCGGRSIATDASPICRACLEKIAGYNAMQEALTDALVSTERVAVAVPQAVNIPYVSPDVAHDLSDRLAGLWQSYPAYQGDLADVDHVGIAEMVPGTRAGLAYLAAHGAAERFQYRLVPGHASTHLAGLEYSLHVLAASAYAEGLAAGLRRERLAP